MGEKLEAAEREAIERAIRTTEYKYFGDYELSGDEREAVDQLVLTAQRYLTATPDRSDDALAEENRRLREVLAMAVAEMENSRPIMVCNSFQRRCAAAMGRTCDIARAALKGHGL